MARSTPLPPWPIRLVQPWLHSLEPWWRIASQPPAEDASARAATRRLEISRRLIYIIVEITLGKIKFIFTACNVKINAFNNLKADVMKKRIVLALFSVNALCIPKAGHAQYVGPTAQLPANSIAEILKKPIDDQKVVVKGHLLRKVSNKRYIFTDGNAEIRVKIDQALFGAKRIDDKTTVEISGEVETEFMKSPEIDVGLISVLP